MGDSAAASEGGADEAALQAQRKRPRTSSLDEVALVRRRLLACAFPGVQDNTSVPRLKVLLFEHGLATCLPGAGALEGERHACGIKMARGARCVCMEGVARFSRDAGCALAARGGRWRVCANDTRGS